MSCLGTAQQLHLRDAISGAAVAHRHTVSRTARPAIVSIQAAQTLQGKVVSAKNPNTIIVAFNSFSEHPLYRKRVQKTSRIVAHDERSIAGLGDIVRLVPCRPVSKTKRFTVDRIVKKFGLQVDEETGEVAALGNFETDPNATPEEEDLGIPEEQLA